MEHTMKLYSKEFELLKTGKKIREYRLYDEKRKLIKLKDTIKFLKLPNLDEECIVEVTNIEIFNDWYSCYKKYFEIDFKDDYKTIEDVVIDTYNGYYTKEESDKYDKIILTLNRK